MGFEQNLQNAIMNNNNQDKSFIDKILDTKDIEKARELIKKQNLTREDLLEILHLLSSAELKLWNLGEWDRYALTKFFVWIREFVKLAEALYDYQDDLNAKENICKNCNGYIIKKINKVEKCKCETSSPTFKLSNRALKIFDNSMRLIEHDIKFLVDLYFNMGRSSLSFKATGLLELLKAKFEFSYPQQAQATPTEAPKKGFFKF